MIKVGLIVLLLLTITNGYCQLNDTLYNVICTMIRADNDLLLNRSKHMNEYDDYISITRMNQSGIMNCEFFLGKVGVDTSSYCEYVIAWSIVERRYFRLRGFKYNEFNEFYNLVLSNGSVMITNPKRGKKAWKEIREQVVIDGFDLRKAYEIYYGKYKSCLFDPTSCYRNSIVWRY